MTHLAHRLYKRWIYPVDPAFLILRFALKAMLAGACALALALALPQLAEIWTVAGALALMLARGGNTIAQRRLFMAGTAILAALFVPVGTMAGNSLVLAWGFSFVLAFGAYFCATFGQSAATSGVWVLILSIIAVGMPGDWDAGMQRSLSILAGGGCSFLVYFLIWPTNPESILRSAGRVALNDVAEFIQPAFAVLRDTPGAEPSRNTAHRQASNSVGGYRRYLEALGYSASQIRPGGDWAIRLYIIQIRLFKAILALSQHAGCLSGSLSPEISEQTRLAGQEAERIVATLAREIPRNGPWPDSSRYDMIVGTLERRMVSFNETAPNPPEQNDTAGLRKINDGHDMVCAFNALYALKTLGREMRRLSSEGEAPEMGPFDTASGNMENI